MDPGSSCQSLQSCGVCIVYIWQERFRPGRPEREQVMNTAVPVRIALPPSVAARPREATWLLGDILFWEVLADEEAERWIP
jgi:hypothetical protein